MKAWWKCFLLIDARWISMKPHPAHKYTRQMHGRTVGLLIKICNAFGLHLPDCLTRPTGFRAPFANAVYRWIRLDILLFVSSYAHCWAGSRLRLGRLVSFYNFIFNFPSCPAFHSTVRAPLRIASNNRIRAVSPYPNTPNNGVRAAARLRRRCAAVSAFCCGWLHFVKILRASKHNRFCPEKWGLALSNSVSVSSFLPHRKQQFDAGNC